MDSLYVRMFGVPGVFKNGEVVVFPFKKAEALFYYLIFKKQATRDEAAGLLWPDMDEEAARKNLRDAIYKIKKALDLDIIISPQKSMLIINPEINIERDLDSIFQGPAGECSGEFLNGFSVKDGEDFDNWVSSMREHFRDMQQKKMYAALKEFIKKGDYNSSEDCAKGLISLDELDEKAYRALMKIYSAKGMYNKAIELYNRLSDILERELGITPDLKTRSVFEKVLEIREKGIRQENKTGAFFFGREIHLKRLEGLYNSFINGKSEGAVVIVGEAGIGKTRLKDEFIRGIKDSTVIIETSCYQAEEAFFLKPWNTVIGKINEIIKSEGIKLPDGIIKSACYMFPMLGQNVSDEGNTSAVSIDSIRYGNSEEAVLEIIGAASEEKKILIVFEDIQWLDNMSLNLLNSLILKGDMKNVIVYATLRNGFNKRLDRLMTQLSKYERLNRIDLERFTREETEEFIKKALPDYNLPDDAWDKIYEETEGNTFFITEFISSISRNQSMDIMSSRVQDVLKSRFLDIPDNIMKLLGIISMFFDEAPLRVIKNISGRDDMEIMDMVEELQERYILREVTYPSDICFKFTHQKLREYIYLQQSEARRRILHGRIGEVLEKDIKGDIRDVDLYSKLIYHFHNGGRRLLSLKYSIKNLNAYLDLNHELFPVLNLYNREDIPYLNSQDAMRQIRDIENLIEEISREDEDSEDILRYKAEFLHIKGRHFIREGEYDKGIQCIKGMIDIAEKISDSELLLKGYKQLVYYCIQTYNAEAMEGYVEKALNIAKDCNNLNEVGSLLRLKGLNRAMMKDFSRAEELLKESINTFNILNQRKDAYSLNIAAAYNYIGEIRRQTMKFSSALSYYDKAISICRDKNSLNGVAVFNGNAGQAAFEMGDYVRAKSYFKSALGIFDKIDSLWGRSIAEGFMTLLLIKEESFIEARRYLERADIHSEKLKSPHEIGLIYRIKAEIKAGMETNKKLEKVFLDYLPEDIEVYCGKGIELLTAAKEDYEAEILNMFRKYSKA